MARPFRWDVARREQLGRLASGEPAESYPEFIEDLSRCCARVIAAAGDSRLVFIGRSPESLFDYLSGVLQATSWAGRPALLNIALRRLDDSDNVPDKRAHRAVKEQFEFLELDPRSIAASRHPIALIDLISSGETMGAVIGLLLDWAVDTDTDPEAVRRRLRVVGITVRGKNSPNAWRWRQRAKWAADFQPSGLKGVSVPWELWDYLGNWQKKVSRTNPPWRWTDAEMQRPPREAEHAEALSLAVQVHESARTSRERAAFATLVAEQPAMRHRWLRSLVTELRLGA